MISFNATLLFIFLSFLIFAWLMKALFFDPVSRIQQQRQAQLVEDQRSADAYLAEKARLEANYQQGISEARMRAQALIQEKRQLARQQSQAVVLEARNSAQARLDKQFEALSRWQLDTREALQPHVREVAAVIVHQLFGENYRHRFVEQACVGSHSH
ncbi:MAG: hypothetical protein SFZ03_05855 [Candidatus Melainabacteria bacterium]|nr:hypothetical protein [Candidatus Melainabacteria bacterium]